MSITGYINTQAQTNSFQLAMQDNGNSWWQEQEAQKNADNAKWDADHQTHSHSSKWWREQEAQKSADDAKWWNEHKDDH